MVPGEEEVRQPKVVAVEEEAIRPLEVVACEEQAG